MAALELMATAVGGPATDPEPGVTGQVPFAGVQMAERRQTRWVLATAPAKGGFWSAMTDAGVRVAEAMSKIDQGVPGDPIPALLVRLNALFESLVSPELKLTLAAAAGTAKAGDPPPILRLHLAPGLDMIPWELLSDRQHFLGLEFQVARMPIISGGPRVTRRVREVTRIATVLGAQVVDDALRPVWDATFDGAVSNGVVVWRSPQAADDWPTVAALPQAFGEIVHITCHGMAKDGGQRYWSLDRTKPDEMEVSVYPPDGDTQFQLNRNSPLVFANACSSATAGAAPGGAPRFTGLAEGFGSTFYDLGASVFVGTIGPVSRRIALEFATRFFKRLLKEGMTAGEALWSTKQSFAEDGEKDPSWLLYCMYGDPETRFVPGGGHGG
jgi:hypothetical protein